MHSRRFSTQMTAAYSRTYLADCGFISSISSEYRKARRNLIESRIILFETAEENPYLNTAYLRGQLPLTWDLLFLGEWGEALRDVEDLIAMLDKNALYKLGEGEAPPPGLAASACNGLCRRARDL